MNFTQLEGALHKGLTAENEPHSLPGKIDDALRRYSRRRLGRRRMTFAFSAALLILVSTIVAPSVQAQVQLNRLAGSLDNVRTLVLIRDSISRDGLRHAIGTITYHDGNWKIEDHENHFLSYFTNGVLYRLDSDGQRFISETGKKGPFGVNPTEVSLSSMLSDLKRWDPRRQVTISNVKWWGKAATQVAVQVPGERSRMVVLADSASDLPLVSREEILDGSDRWIATEEMRFEYDRNVLAADVTPDLNSHPAVSRDVWAKSYVDSLTTSNLGSRNLPNGKQVVIRSIDVARNGVVYVLYQAGERIARWEKGYATFVTDDLGTQYCCTPFTSQLDPDFIQFSKFGKAEVDVFVPVDPVDQWRPRTITVGIMMNPKGRLMRKNPAVWMNSKGVSTSMRWYYDSSQTLDEVDLCKKRFAEPSAATFPSHIRELSPTECMDDARCEVKWASARADYYREVDDRDQEIRWLREAVRLAESDGQTIGSSNAKRRLEELGAD